MMFEYLLSRSRSLAVLLIEPSPEALEQLRTRIAGGGFVSVLGARRTWTSKARRNGVRAFHQLLRGRIAPLGSEVFLSPQLRGDFARIAKAFAPQLSVITYVPYAGLITALPPNSRAIIDPIDIYRRIHHAYADQTRIKRLFAPIRFGYRESGALYEAERNILSRYDGVLAISAEDERAYLAAGLAAGRVGFLEACVREIASMPTAADPAKDIDLLFVGARFPGTEQGLRFLLREVMPNLRGPLSLAVVGHIGDAMPEHRGSLPSWLRLETPGYVEDLKPFYCRSKVVVLPIPLGTGTSVKMQEALSQGACVVTTTIGSRIRGITDGVNCLVRDEPLSFAMAITELLENPGRRATLGAAALATARDSYSLEAVYSYLDTFIARQTTLDPRPGEPLLAEENAVGQ